MAAPVRAASAVVFGMRLRILLLLASVPLAGCQQRDRYQIVPAGENRAFRLDKETGEVRFIVMRRSFAVEDIEDGPESAPAP